MPATAETIAQAVLTRNGIEAVWALEEAAAEAHRMGRNAVAITIMEVADAAEQQLRLAASPNDASRSRGGGTAAAMQQTFLEVFSWAVMFGFIAALFAEAYR